MSTGAIALAETLEGFLLMIFAALRIVNAAAERPDHG